MLATQLDEMADEEVYRLRQLMDVAVETDKEAVQDGRPAIEKLKLLPDVVAVLQKCVLGPSKRLTGAAHLSEPDCVIPSLSDHICRTRFLKRTYLRRSDDG